ncbi:protease HtpX [Nitrospira moscoviensis]|uniref:Protease HtpX n=1 Tax=Nitrospira moscoviensis TaxID=42253 RepID=A0A0K2G9D3_NITMO|nr:protease HtpX [Nitrospira moscoviensis]ALA57563.1 Protease HtpX [Nitrospira moscoviensis]
MKWLKGIALLLIANLLFMVAINVIVSIVLPAFGITLGADTTSLLTVAGLFGFGGAFFSLAFSKQFARAALGERYQITQPRTQAEHVIYGAVQEIAQRLRITMPEVWVYESADPNAFATGPTRNNSMVAVSTGLLNNLDEQEVRAVLAHEMGHVFNGDMFTTTVLAGLMNTFVYFISMLVRRFFAERDQAGLGFALSFVVQIVLGFLAMIPIMWHSRRREFGADAFAAKVYGRESMISALRAIDGWVARTQMAPSSTADPLATFKIAGQTGGLLRLFASHPPIEERIAALQRL